MSMIVIALSVLLSLSCALFAIDVGRVTWDRAKAETAADAAALAAAAESGPYGSGDPELEAKTYADANGAQLVQCLCDVGGTAMQVKVSLHDVTAQARAVLDPSLLRPSVVAFDPGGIQPALADAVNRLVIAGHGAIRVVSGLRSSAAQTALWNRAVDRYGDAKIADDWVAPPGSSMHERGLAVDLGGDLELAVHLIARKQLPLYRPLANEPWHFELRGSRAAQ